VGGRRLVERSSRLVLGLAPQPFRRAWGDDLVLTLADACADARQRRGSVAAMRLTIVELLRLAAASLRARAGVRTSITGGFAPRRESRRTGRLSRLANDLRLGWRALAASPLTTTVAVVTLALGIGVNTAAFSILDATVLRPMPFAQADRLTEIWNYDSTSNFGYPGFSSPLLREWRRQTDLFDRVEGYDITSYAYDAPGGAEMLTGAVVTPGVLGMLGVPPIAGRLFTEGDGRGGTDARVVISERFWSESLGRAGDVVGRSLTFNGRGYEIVGVMPASFMFPGQRTMFWVPYDADAPPAQALAPPRLTAFARRAAAISNDGAMAAVKERGLRVATAAGVARPLTASLMSRGAHRDEKTSRSLMVLGGAVLFLLLIVCANLANLSLSRTLARARDFSVRAAIGATGVDLIRETLVENLIVGAAGAAAGCGVAAVAIQATRRLLPTSMTISSMNAIDLDGRALAFTALAGVVTALVFGLGPAILASRAGVAGMLQRDSRSATGSIASRRLRQVLVVVEVALAIVLLVGAALMARTVVRLNAIDRGFDTAGLVALRVGLPAPGYVDPYARDAFVEAMMTRARSLPGVIAVTSGAVPPETSQINFGQIETGDRPGVLSDELVLPVYAVWPNYFDVIGLPIRQGRAFAADEPTDHVVVSESFARRFWPDRDPVGATFKLSGASKTVVGVAAEVRQFELDDSAGSFELYFPLQRPRGLAPAAASPPDAAIVAYRTVVARAADAAAAAEPLKRLVHQVDPRVVVWTVDPVERLFDEAIARPRLVLLLMSVFAGAGLVLAAAGIYGELSCLVAQRRREIGIRVALGARPEGIRRLVVGGGLKLTFVGLVIGVLAARSLVRVMQALLFEVEPSDAASIAAVVAAVTVVAVAASWWPARTAMRIDPVSLLRED
jgi:predicted permease